MGDLILGLILLIALLDGWRRGVIKILGSYGGVIIGVFLARRLTPAIVKTLLPQLEAQIGSAIAAGNPAGGAASPLLAEWFFTNSALGRLLELVIFVALTSAITWLVRFATGSFGSMVNFTPLIGHISRSLGALLQMLIYVMIIYCVYVWILPWLISIAPEIAVVNTIFTSSQLVLQLILEIGSMIWYSALSII